MDTLDEHAARYAHAVYEATRTARRPHGNKLEACRRLGIVYQTLNRYLRMVDTLEPLPPLLPLDRSSVGAQVDA